MLLTDVRLGNLDHALLSRLMTRGHEFEWNESPYERDGWQVIREGNCFTDRRNVLLSPDKVIYKVGYDIQTCRENEWEMAHFRRLGSDPLPGWKIPEMALYEFPERSSTVLAVQYIKGEKPEYEDYRKYEVEDTLNLDDLHRHNLVVKDGAIWIIDLAGSPWSLKFKSPI